MSLAIFDLDNTLLGDDSDYLWGQFLVQQGLVDGEFYTRENQRFYKDYQTGKLDNNILGSGIKIDGDYFTLDLSAQLHLAKLLQNTNWLNRWYVTGGYAYSKWDYDDTTVNILSNNISIPRVLDMDFTHTNLYFGLGYQF